MTKETKKAYCKIENKKAFSITNNEKIALELKLKEYELELSDIDGGYYLAGHAPMKTDEDKARETDEAEIAKIDEELLTLDKKSPRDLRSGLIGVVDALEKILTNIADVKGNLARLKDVKAKIEFLRTYENDAIAKRERRAELWAKWHK